MFLSNAVLAPAGRLKLAQRVVIIVGRCAAPLHGSTSQYPPLPLGQALRRARSCRHAGAAELADELPTPQCSTDKTPGRWTANLQPSGPTPHSKAAHAQGAAPTNRVSTFRTL